MAIPGVACECLFLLCGFEELFVIEDFDVALSRHPHLLRRFLRGLLPRKLVHLLGIESLSASVTDPGPVTILEMSGCFFVET